MVNQKVVESSGREKESYYSEVRLSTFAENHLELADHQSTMPSSYKKTAIAGCIKLKESYMR